MAEEGGAPPDTSAPEAENTEAGMGEGTVEDKDGKGDVEKTGVKIDEVASRISRKQSMFQTNQEEADEILDVDRTALEAILDVSARLKDIQKKSKISMSTLALGHESYKDKQVNKVP